MEIDFEKLSYNLYEILNVDRDVSKEELKESYKKSILKYHPDKNSKTTSEEFFNKINIAFKVLSNKDHKNAYDEWLSWNEEHHRLKKSSKLYYETGLVKPEKTYIELEKELNEKHGYNDNEIIPLEKDKFMNNLRDLKSSRETFKIDYEKISNVNEGFDKLKSNPENFNTQIMEYKGEIMEYNTGGGTSLSDIGNLYKSGGSVVSNNITSLDQAFSIRKTDDYKDDGISLEDRIKEYHKNTPDRVLDKIK